MEKKLGRDLEKTPPLIDPLVGLPGRLRVCTRSRRSACKAAARGLANGEIVDAAHVFVGGSTGPKAKVATELMHDVPCDRLADSLKSLVRHAPMKGGTVMYTEAINTLADQAAAKLAGQRRSLVSHFVRSMLAGMYVGAAIVLIFTIGAFINTSARGGRNC